MQEFLRRDVKPESKNELVDGIMRFWGTVTVPKCRKYIQHLQKVIPIIIEVNGEATGFKHHCTVGVIRRELLPLYYPSHNTYVTCHNDHGHHRCTAGVTLCNRYSNHHCCTAGVTLCNW